MGMEIQRRTKCSNNGHRQSGLRSLYTEAGAFSVSLRLFSAGGVLLGEDEQNIAVHCDLVPTKDAMLDKDDCDEDAPTEQVGNLPVIPRGMELKLAIST